MATPKTRRRQPAAARDADQQAADDRARLLGIIAYTPDAIVTVDERQRITMFNPAAERMFRCQASEAIGTSLDRFIPARGSTSSRSAGRA